MMLLLHSPETLFFLSLLLEERLLNNLLIALMKNGSLLFVIKTLEVVGLNTMRS
jgi:hypothetical protein